MNRSEMLKNVIRQTMFVDKDIAGTSVWYAGRCYKTDDIEYAVNCIYADVYGLHNSKKCNKPSCHNNLSDAIFCKYQKWADIFRFICDETAKIITYVRDDIDAKYGCMCRMVQM